MSINIEKLYALATENLECLCWGYAKENSMGSGAEFFERVKQDPRTFARYYPALAAALEIWETSREEVLRAKNGSAYAAVKRVIKSAKNSIRNVHGYWIDSEERQCFCDGYRAIRLKKHMDGFDAVEGINLDNLMTVDGEPTELQLPTIGELKACIAEQKGRSQKRYDFGDGLPLVNPEYLRDMMEIFPNAAVKSYGINRPIIFESDAGDGLMLPIHKGRKEV